MIDQEGIKSLEKGASNIRLTGNEGESSPIQEQLKKRMSENFPIKEYMEEFEKVFPDMIPLRGTDEYNDALEDYFRGLAKGPVLPSDEDPINPFGPKPIGPLPDRQMAAFGGIMGLDNRKQYGIGSKLKRALRKITRPVTRVAQKLVPKEAAGILRMAAPFMGPIAGPLAYLGGTAKQKGRISPMDLALSFAPQIGRISTGGDTTIASRIGDLPAFGKTPFDTRKTLKEFLVGGNFEGAGETSGIFGKGGEMFQFGSGDVDIFDTKAGQVLFGKETSKDSGIFEPNILKLGSWGTAIASNIKAKKYLNEMEAANAAEDALLAEDAAASEEKIQAARDWAMETFSKLTMADFAVGGRVGFSMGGLGLGALAVEQNPDIKILTGSENTIDAEQIYPSESPIKDMEITLMMGDSDRNNSPPLKMNDGRFLFNGRIFNSEEDLNKYMLQLMPFKADGGRINKNMGGEFNMPPAGLSSLQTQPSDVTPQGMELDLRGGGFIPIGKAEKADDVPARVSKNEFVFTADAVKAAGGGSVNEGAKRMYDTMKRLESQVV